MTDAEAAKETKVHASAYGCITLPFLLLVLLTLGWGGRNQWIAGELMRSGEVVPGRVIELRFVASNGAVVSSGTRGGSSRGESPVVTFRTSDGQDRTAIGSVNRKPAPWKVGDTVDVVYDAKDPSHADLVSEVSSWQLWFGVWCVLALLLAGIASLPIVFRLRQSPDAQ